MKASKDRVVWCDRGWQPVCYGFCPSEKAWNHAMRRLGLKEPYPTSDGRTTTFEQDVAQRACVIVTLSDRAIRTSQKVEIVGLLIHEAVHVWQEVRERMRESRPSTEFEAYSIQAIAQELIEACSATRRRLA